MDVWSVSEATRVDNRAIQVYPQERQKRLLGYQFAVMQQPVIEALGLQKTKKT